MFVGMSTTKYHTELVYSCVHDCSSDTSSVLVDTTLSPFVVTSILPVGVIEARNLKSWSQHTKSFSSSEKCMCDLRNTKRTTALSGIYLQTVSSVGAPHNVHSHDCIMQLLDEIGQEDMVSNIFAVVDACFSTMCEQELCEKVLLDPDSAHLLQATSVDMVPHISAVWLCYLGTLSYSQLEKVARHGFHAQKYIYS